LLVRRDALERVGGFDESPEQVSVEDWDLYLRLAGQAEFVCLPRVLTRYLSTADQLSGRLDVVITGHRAILERYRDDIEAGGPGLLAVHHFRLGSLLCLDGRVGEGRALLRRAAREDPARIKHWLGLAAAAGGQRNFRLLTTVNRLGHRGWRRLRHRRFATRDRGGTDR
jgi:GT2 family glycosyltransferase